CCTTGCLLRAGERRRNGGGGRKRKQRSSRGGRHDHRSASTYRINNAGALFLTGSTVSNNTDSFEGGGIINNGSMTITNSTISGNQVTGVGGSASGGVIDQGMGATVINSTITNNTPVGYASFSTESFKNTIVANNGPPTSADLSGTFTSGGYNLIGKADGATGFTGTGDQTGTIALPLDPKLGPLQLNAPGVTPTQALLTGSPAIDQIPHTGGCNNAGVMTDQRGVARPQPAGSKCDIGAYEVLAAPPAPLPPVPQPTVPVLVATPAPVPLKPTGVPLGPTANPLPPRRP
ncbi:MAG: choice-of-anchor Q domain-containing protein, partial [Thermomicrobiales bacterium]